MKKKLSVDKECHNINAEVESEPEVAQLTQEQAQAQTETLLALISDQIATSSMQALLSKSWDTNNPGTSSRTSSNTAGIKMNDFPWMETLSHLMS